MTITRNLHGAKRGRLLVHEETPGVSINGIQLSALANGVVEVQLSSDEHVWRVVFTKAEFEKIKIFQA